MAWPREDIGCYCPQLCQDSARDFLNSDEKIGGGGVVANLQRCRGSGQQFSIMPPTFIVLAMPLIKLQKSYLTQSKIYQISFQYTLSRRMLVVKVDGASGRERPMKRLWKCVKLSEYETIASCREETPHSFIQYDDGNR